MPTLNIQISTEKINTADFLKPGQGDENIRRCADYLKKISTGHIAASVDIADSATAPVAASGTFTLTSAIATDAVTIGNVTMTATSTPSVETDWEIDGATDADDATSLAAAINAHSVLGALFTATSASNVVTVTCKEKGLFGNLIAFTSADATIVASGSGFLASGAGGAGANSTPVSISKT